MSELDTQQFEGFIRECFSRAGLPIGRCSHILFSQLANMPNYGWGMNFPFQFVQSEIAHLEGKGETATKKVRFRKPLRGFFHKHFYVPGYEHPGMNIKNAWEFDKPDSDKFSCMVAPIAERYAASTQTDGDKLDFAKAVAGNIMKELYNRRQSGKTTGDWIVYTEHNSEKYYLCIAKHGEYDFIRHTLHLCAQEFPFIEGIFREHNAPDVDQE